MKTFLKISLWMAIVVLSVISCTSKTEKTLSSLNSFLDSLESVYAPDKRIALWKINIEVKEEICLAGVLGNAEASGAIDDFISLSWPEVRNELELLAGSEGMVVNGLVNNSVIHLRREPSSKKEMVTQALLGTPLNILKEKDGKCLVQIPDGYLGWVNIPEVHVLDAEALAAYKAADKIIFTAQYGFAYSEADDTSLPVSDLVIGDILVAESESKNFYRVRYPDERIAWVKKKETIPAGSIFNKQASGEDLVETAMNFHGIPYLWGGTSSKNIDCSGLVYNIYYMNGIQMPRDADMQSLCGLELTTSWDSSVLESGDLLFFGRRATDSQEENVSHVAMYIGEGEFIHSAGYRERVSINHMDSTQCHFIENYPDIFIRAVRILGQEGGDFRPVHENVFFKAIMQDE